MFAASSMMHHDFAAAAMSAEAAASFCAVLLLGSAIQAESIFVVVLAIVLAVGIISPLPATAE